MSNSRGYRDTGLGESMGLEQVASDRWAGECGRVGELTHGGSGTGRGEAEEVVVEVAELGG